MSDNASLPEQPFISHLIELRDRLMRMVLAVVVLLLALFPFGNDIFHVLAQPVINALPEGNSMVATKVLSPFLTPLKLAFVAAVFVAMPYLLYQLWSFIAPGLYQHEKRLAIPLLVSSIVLFYLGGAFAYLVVLPLLFPFLVGVTPEDVKVMPDIADFLDIAIRLFFAFGMAFEVPIATILLVMAGVTTPETLAEKRPYVIVGAFVLGMLLTPPDVISQTLLALPMWLLFEVGLFFSRILMRDRRRPDESGDAAPGPGGQPNGDFKPLDGQEMEDEFARIEAEFEALDASSAKDAGSASTASDDDADATNAGAAEDAQDAAPDADGWTAADSADMLDEEDFPARSASEAMVEAKLEQVAALRATEAYGEARRLLYEILSEGNAEQIKVARNILGQLDG